MKSQKISMSREEMARFLSGKTYSS